jgi:hypothetical protein
MQKENVTRLTDIPSYNLTSYKDNSGLLSKYFKKLKARERRTFKKAIKHGKEFYSKS